MNMDDTPFDDDDIQTEITRTVIKSEKRQKRDEGWHIGTHGNLLPRINNILKLCKDDENLKNLWRLNEFTKDVEYDKDSLWGSKAGECLTDKDDIFLLGYLAEKYHYEPEKGKLSDSVLLLAKKKSVHPIKFFLESRVWDGEKRLDVWLSKTTGAEQNIYIQDAGRKLLCASVARIYEPGCKFDHMLILEGKQRTFKSTLIEILGGEWYSTINMIEDVKTAVDVMRGKWFLEMEELAAMRRADVEHAKAFVSRKTDRVRLSYGRRAEDFKRQSVIIGTLNPIGDNQYFRDMSGNTRFWPVVCEGKIDIGWAKENRDQLFAEAMQVWKEENLFLDSKEAMQLAEAEQEKRQMADAWEELIEDWVGIKDFVTPTQILIECLGVSKDKIIHSNLSRVGIAMRRLGWEIRQFGGKHKKYYLRPGADINIINTAINNAKEELWDEEEKQGK